MARGFSRSRRGVVLKLASTENAVLAGAITDLGTMVRSPEAGDDEDPLAAMVGIDDEVQRPEDPAAARLFPDAYTDDEEAAAEFRRYTERRLRTLRSERVELCLAALGRSGDGDKVVLTDEEVQAFLTVLNDLRLVLGTRLDITDDDVDPAQLVADDDPRRPLADLYLWITWLQSALLHAITS